MTALVILACSILHDGGQCREFELTYADVSVMTCMMAGLPEVAKWGAEHPQWAVKRWKCRPAGMWAKA
jgi:hypothetical protein